MDHFKFSSRTRSTSYLLRHKPFPIESIVSTWFKAVLRFAVILCFHRPIIISYIGVIWSLIFYSYVYLFIIRESTNKSEEKNGVLIFLCGVECEMVVHLVRSKWVYQLDEYTLWKPEIFFRNRNQPFGKNRRIIKTSFYSTTNLWSKRGE